VIYLDANATAPLTTIVSNALKDAIDGIRGNPSSAHAFGNAARQAISNSRDALAELVGAHPGDVFFTSGATEANNWVLRSAVAHHGHSAIATTRVEHPSVVSTLDSLSSEGCSVKYLALDSLGQVDLEQFAQALTSAIRLVSVQWVNGETGIVRSRLFARSTQFSFMLTQHKPLAASRLISANCR